MKAPPGLHIRDSMVDGVGPWMWRQADYWGWEHPRAGFSAMRDLVLTHAKECKVMVQAGGCMGMYPRLWSDHFETVYTFEPDPINFYCLTANCPSERIVKVQAALGETAGVASLTAAPEFNAGFFKLEPSLSGTTLVLRLDDLNLPRIDVLQLDCEGGEDGIIKGGLQAISKHLPLIIIEKPSDGLRGVLEGFGYREVGRTPTIAGVIDVIFKAA